MTPTKLDHHRGKDGKWEGRSGVRCPRCSSDKVNRVETVNSNGNVMMGNYCIDCFTEFTQSWKVLEPIE